MTNPYSNLEAVAFWRKAISEQSCFDVSGLWSPKFRFDKLPIFTAGSCFAQHFGRALFAAGLDWIEAEAAPFGTSDELKRRFNYGVFSTRTANIYTTAMLRQWLELCFEENASYDEVWENNGRFFDPLRPTIEPDGFESIEELFDARAVTVKAMKHALENGCIFVFTLGLTESWMNKTSGMHYAACPGTQAGNFDPTNHIFKNLTFHETSAELNKSIAYIRKANGKNRVLLTVSPVPLTATASGEHVLTATVRSKSILRAVAGEISDGRSNVDYFPSYEIITGIPFRSMWFEPNLRSVRKEGVDFVMKNFFREHEKAFGPLRIAKQNRHSALEEDVVCEEALLEAFGRA